MNNFNISSRRSKLLIVALVVLGIFAIGQTRLITLPSEAWAVFYLVAIGATPLALFGMVLNAEYRKTKHPRRISTLLRLMFLFFIAISLLLLQSYMFSRATDQGNSFGWMDVGYIGLGIVLPFVSSVLVLAYAKYHKRALLLFPSITMFLWAVVMLFIAFREMWR